MREPARKWDNTAPMPVCPGCTSTSFSLELSQPDKGNPDVLIGWCPNPQCGQLTEFHRSPATGRWVVRSRSTRPKARTTA